MTSKFPLFLVRLFKRGCILFLSILLILVGIEGIGLFYFGLIQRISRERLIDVYRKDEEKGSMTWVLNCELHPFLLYAEKNIVFLEKTPPSMKPTAPRLAILGGSVARLFADWDSRTQGFRRALKEQIPCLQGVPIEIINLAGGGYKQPQQLIAAALFNRYADYFINLDGFNEATSSPYGTKFPAMYPNLTPYFLKGNYKAKGYQFMGNLSRLIFDAGIHAPENIPSLRKSYGYLLFWKLTRSLTVKTFRICELHFVAANQEARPKEILPGVLRVNLWKESMLQEHLLLKANDKPHLFYIQPNLHVKNSKPLSSREQEFVRNNPHFSRIGDVMKLEIASIPEFRKLGVPVHDLTQIFSAETQTTYSDRVGHLTELGNRMVAERMAKDFSRIFKCQK